MLCLSTRRWSFFVAWLGLAPVTLLSALLTLVLCCPFLPSRPTLLNSEAFFTSFGQITFLKAIVELVVTVRTGEKSVSRGKRHSSYNEAQIHRHWRFNHQFPGTPDEKQQKKRKDASKREMRECSRDALRTFFLHTRSSKKKSPCKVIAGTFCSLSLSRIIDRSINNLPLLLLDVNVYVLQLPEASFQCTRRNQTLKMTRDGDPNQ